MHIGGGMAAVQDGVHRAALLGADVVVMPEGVGNGPNSLRDFESLAVAARVAIAATFIDDGVPPSEQPCACICIDTPSRSVCLPPSISLRMTFPPSSKTSYSIV